MKEFKSKKISVNCLALGAVQTEMLSKAFPGYKAPLLPNEMANFIVNFALTGHQYFNGKIIQYKIPPQKMTDLLNAKKVNVPIKGI